MPRLIWTIDGIHRQLRSAWASTGQSADSNVNFCSHCLCFLCFSHVLMYSKTCVNGHSQRDRKLVFKTSYRLLQVKVLQNAPTGAYCIELPFVIKIFVLFCFLQWPFYTVFIVLLSVLSFLLQSPHWGRESWLIYFHCFLAAVWLLLFCVSSPRCPGLVCDYGISWSYWFIFL